MVQLKNKIANLEDVPEGLRGFYSESPDGDGFNCDIQLEGAQAASSSGAMKLAEFRDNNRRLRKENESLLASQGRFSRFEGMDDEQIQTLVDDAARAQALEDKKMIDEGKAEELFTRRTQEIIERHKAETGAYTSKLEEFQGKFDGIEQKYHGLLIDTQLQTALNGAAAPRKQALVDIQNRARSVWGFTPDGEMSATDPAIGGPMLDNDGKAMTMGSWVGQLVENSPHLFEASQGGGGGGSDGARIRGSIDGIDIGANLDAVAKGQLKVT